MFEVSTSRLQEEFPALELAVRRAVSLGEATIENLETEQIVKVFIPTSSSGIRLAHVRHPRTGILEEKPEVSFSPITGMKFQRFSEKPFLRSIANLLKRHLHRRVQVQDAQGNLSLV